jgi:hypothetical protein
MWVLATRGVTNNKIEIENTWNIDLNSAFFPPKF